MLARTRTGAVVERSWARTWAINPGPGTFPYVEGNTGSVCFLVCLNGKLLTGFASALWLYRRYGRDSVRDGLVAAYKANAADIDAEVIRRVNAGAVSPVRLRGADS